MSLTRPIILSRPDRVGDAIITSAVFAAVKAAHPEAPLYYAAREVMRPLFGQHPLLAGFVASDQAEERLRELLQRIRAEVVVHLQPDETLERAAAWAEIPHRLGYWPEKATGPARLTDGLWDLRKLSGMHEHYACFELLSFPPLSVAPRKMNVPSVAPFPEARERVAELGLRRPYAAINPGAHSDTLRWPAERFAELAGRLESELGLGVVVIGAQAEDPSVRTVLERNPNARCLAGQTDLAELAWVLRDAAVHVSRDTGTAHLASAMGCSVVTLFGRTEPEYGPERWRPLGPGPVHLVETDIGSKRWFGLEPTRAYWRRGFERIGVESVFAAVQRALG